MAGFRSRGASILILYVLLFKSVYSSPVNISPQSVPEAYVQRAINSLNQNSPTQHTYRGGNLISAQKLLEPSGVIYRLTLNLDTVCSEDLTNCPREACAIDLHDRSGVIDVERSSIQCMYLYPQSVQEDVQQVESIVQEAAQVEGVVSDNGEEVKSEPQSTLRLDHEIEAAVDSERPEADAPDRPFIAVRAPNPKYCPGCPYELNPNLPGLAAFGIQALDVMDGQGHNDFKHKLIRIIKVTRAVPPGSNVVRYKLLAEIGETNCLKTTLIERSECSLQGNVPLRLCLVTFEERPWQQSDRQVVANNCTESSDLENEINSSLNSGLNGQPERVDSVQEVIGKTAHIDQLAQEGKIGTYDSLIDQILESPSANVTSKTSNTEVPYFEGVSPGEHFEPFSSIRRNTLQQTNQEGSIATEAPFVKVELERVDDRQPVQGFVDKQREFDEFLSDFDIPLRDTVVAVTEENREPVAEEIIRPQRGGGQNVAKNAADSTVECESAESVESEESAESSQRRKRALTKALGSETMLIKQLAQKAVETLDDIDKDHDKRVVRRILDSKKQQSDGYHYYLVLEVAMTDCREEDIHRNDKDCLDEITGPLRICKVQIHTDEKNPLLSARVVKSECAKEAVKGKHVRNRRSPSTLGSPEPISIDDPEVKRYAAQAVAKFSETSEGTNEPILMEIKTATSQVVAGTLYRINITLGTSDCPKGTKENCKLLADCEQKECQIKVWSRPWLIEGGLEIEINCNAHPKAKRSLREQNARNRRSRSLPGSQNSISVDNPEVQKYAAQAVHKFSETFEGTNEPILTRIKDATIQVVAGTLYKINITLGTSDCPKGTKENCRLLADYEQKECQVEVWSRPWLTEGGLDIWINCDTNSKAKRSLKDKNVRKKRKTRVHGAPNSISIEDPEVQRYAGLGVQKISENFEGPNELILDRLESATRQVVAGSLVRVIAILGTSDCPKGTKENCRLQANSESKRCEIRAWSRPWLQEGALDIQVNCDLKNRSKRSLKGKNYSQKMLQQATYLKNERLFDDFVVKYNKSYSSTFERKNRFKIFHQNMLMVQELQRNEQGTAIYGASMFADLTTEEFKKNYLGLKPELRLDNEIPIPMAEIPDIEIPNEYDWRNYNVVTPVKNQGSCGSCWAFSVTGNVEGQYALRHRTLLSFSEQELVDCDTLDEGCNGGLPDNAYRAIEKLGGLELESDYPYDGENEVCHFNKSEARVKVVSAVNITSNETQMAQWLVQNGPISIGINANAMQFYMGGVSHPFKFLCSPDNLDHGVLIVGYGTHTYPIFHKTLPYWTIKNSWGPGWGEQGYYRVYRGDGTCGVNQMASSAVVA